MIFLEQDSQKITFLRSIWVCFVFCIFFFIVHNIVINMSIRNTICQNFVEIISGQVRYLDFKNPDLSGLLCIEVSKKWFLTTNMSTLVVVSCPMTIHLYDLKCTVIILCSRVVVNGFNWPNYIYSRFLSQKHNNYTFCAMRMCCHEHGCNWSLRTGWALPFVRVGIDGIISTRHILSVSWKE